MKINMLCILCSLFLYVGCSQVNSPENPKWIDELITKYENQPVGKPPQSIWQYSYKGENVYYIPPKCCDQYGELYDKDGNYLCAPDGGFSGTGDGQCPDFFNERENEKLIWKDSREYKTL